MPPSFSRGGASGGFVPVRELRRRGLEPTTAFAHLAYAGSHAAALESVASGRADVALLAFKGDVMEVQTTDYGAFTASIAPTIRHSWAKKGVEAPSVE